MNAIDIITVLRGVRLPLSDEKRTQDGIEEEFQRRGMVFEREARLSPTDRPDFVVARVAVEVKVKGQKRAIYRQLERYAQHDDIDEIVLVTNVPMGLPAEIKGKPVYVVNLARAWL